MPESSWNAVAAVVAEEFGIPADAIMTEEQLAEFRERFAEAIRDNRPQVIQPGSPLSDHIELAKINDTLRATGFEYPLGARGVQDLADGYRLRQEELHRLDPDHWAAMEDRSEDRPPGMYRD